MNNYLDLYNSKTSFNKGNLFKNYYWPYKYEADLKPSNQKEELMYKLQEYCFNAHEINLYLDTHPNDSAMIGLYNQYKEMADRYTKEYENKYGLISLDVDDSNYWKWINSPWPWESE